MAAGMLDWREVERRRAGCWLGHPVIYRERIDSTNSLAASLIPYSAPSGTVVVADEQSAGRGRLGRRWVAPAGEALLFSVVLGPHSPAWTAPLAAGLALADAVASLGLRVGLKWPNDLLLGGRKCAGILAETCRVDAHYWIVLGIGLNVHSADPALPAATYLDAELSTPVRREDLLVEVLTCLERRCRQASADADALRDAWRGHLTTLGRNVVVQTPAGAFEGQAEDIGADGALIVRLAGGGTRAVQAGDVTLAGTRQGDG